MSVIGQEAGIEHGTLKGSRQHYYRKVDACDPCLKAARDRATEHRLARKKAGPVERAALRQAAWHGKKPEHEKKRTLVVPNPVRSASLTVAAWSKDADECREFLTMLDLLDGAQ